MTDTTPFLGESEEEIAKGVVNGLRPEWPSDSSSQGLVDALRKLVEACWGQELKERPTASEVLQTMLTLNKERPQGRQESPELDYTWDYVEDTSEPSTFGFYSSGWRD